MERYVRVVETLPTQWGGYKVGQALGKAYHTNKLCGRAVMRDIDGIGWKEVDDEMITLLGLKECPACTNITQNRAVLRDILGDLDKADALIKAIEKMGYRVQIVKNKR